jgi:hypothetical protein
MNSKECFVFRSSSPKKLLFMATKFIKPETIPLFITTTHSEELEDTQVIEMLSQFRTKDKIIKHQLAQIVKNLEWNAENQIYTSPIMKSLQETPKKKSSESPKKKRDVDSVSSEKKKKSKK